MRQEPPIPVERVIVNEKPSGEKSDKIAVGTFMPEIKGILETVKTLSENLNVQSQNTVNTDTAKLDESVVTLKAEEKIKIIEEKERAMDLQKNDNLNLNLDAIKKEESELAADGDVANVRTAERHEQLRKTLEKHKLEQRQMMQEQKEILKDIKEQKQEFEREKQRMAKDEVFKKNEKTIQINGKENILPENKDNLREDDSKTIAKNNEIDVEKSVRNKETLKNEELTKKRADKVELVMLDNDAADLIKDTSRDKNVEEEQKIPGNVADVPIKEAVHRKIPEELPMHKDKIKMGKIKLNDSESVKSPILNVLSKGALQRLVVEEGHVKENDDHRTKEEKREVITNEIINTSDKLQGKYDDFRYSVPIALKMMNQSKTDNAIVPSLNKSEPLIQAIHRDILENYEREKRDINVEASATDIKVDNDHSVEESKSLRVKAINDANGESCLKLQDGLKKFETGEEFKKRTIVKSSTTEAPLIKTNVYLSEQGITKIISMEPRVGHSVEYISMKQKYLKTSRELHKENVEI